MAIIQSQTGRYVAVGAGILCTAVVAHQLWKQMGPSSSEAISARLNQSFNAFHAIKGAVLQQLNALQAINPAQVQLSAQDIAKAREVALDAMKNYSLQRAVEAHPNYSAENAEVLKAEVSRLIQSEFELLVKGEGEHAQHFENCLRDYFKDAHSSPVAESLFVVGGFGAGKSTLERIAAEGEVPDLKATGKLLKSAKDFNFRRDVWPYIPSYNPDAHKETFWKIRPLHAGFDSAIRFLTEEKKVTRKEGTSLTPAPHDRQTIDNSVKILKEMSEKRNISMVGVFVTDPAIAIGRVAARAQQNNQQINAEEVKNTNISLSHVYHEYLPYVSGFKLFLNDQKNQAPVLVAEKKDGALVPVKGQRTAFQAFVSQAVG